MTGVVYDDKFSIHKCLWDENYSESPQRYTSILDRYYYFSRLKYIYYLMANQCMYIALRLTVAMHWD